MKQRLTETKKIIQFPLMGWSGKFVFFVLVSLCGCAQVVTQRNVVDKPEYHKKEYQKRLVVERAAEDDSSSHVYKMRLKEDRLVHTSMRNVTTITTKRYPFSAGRKVDEILFGTLGAPFAPLAILGGIANDDPDFAFFPITALLPFRNFKPDKGGLLTGPVKAEVQEKTIKSNWRHLGQKHTVKPAANTEFWVLANGKKLKVRTDAKGKTALDLSHVPGVGNEDLQVSIYKGNDLLAEHTIDKKRLSALPRWRIPKTKTEVVIPPVVKTTPKFIPKEPSVGPNDLPPLIAGAKKADPKSAEVEKKAPTDNKVAAETRPKTVPAPELKPVTGNVERAVLFKGLTHGYWIKQQDGFPIMALPVESDVTVHKDGQLKESAGQSLALGKEYYIFDFTFDSKSNRNISAKVGNSPLEKEALGWVKARDIYVWNTLNRLRATKPFTIYGSSEACLSGAKESSSVYGDVKEQEVFPVLERRGDAWCIAYPGNNDRLRHGWVRWSDSGLQVEVRAMKHKLDMAIRYLEKRLIYDENSEALTKEFTVELQGPLQLVRAKEDLLFSALTREKESQERKPTSLIEVPSAQKDYELFQRQVFELGSLLTRKELWENNDDVVYLPAARDGENENQEEQE